MDSQVLAAPLVRARSRRSTLVIALVAAAVGATAAIALLTGGSPDRGKRATELHGPGFTLAYPAGWSAVPAERLAAAPGQPAAIVRRADGKGVVIVRRKPA